MSVAPPASVPLLVNGISSFYSSSSAPYRPTINLTGSALNSITQITWECYGERFVCPDSPYVWTPQNWAGRFTPSSDGTSATVSPVLIASGDLQGTYQWIVSFSNGIQSVSTLFFVTYGSSPAPIPAMPSAIGPGNVTSPGPLLGGTSVALSWSAVSGATSYSYGVRDMTSNTLVVDSTTAGTSIGVNLTAGRTYRWNVAACNSAGCSSFTTPLYFRTP